MSPGRKLILSQSVFQTSSGPSLPCEDTFPGGGLIFITEPNGPGPWFHSHAEIKTNLGLLSSHQHQHVPRRNVLYLPVKACAYQPDRLALPGFKWKDRTRVGGHNRNPGALIW